MRLNDLLALSHVPRWSIVSHTRPQSVADHTFRVLVIAVELAEMVGVTLHANDLIRILYHDGHESWTADLPSPIKSELEKTGYSFDRVTPWARSTPEFTGPDQERVFELADKIEAYTFIDKYGEGEQSLRVRDGCLDRLNGLIPDRNWKKMADLVIVNIMEERGRGCQASESS